MRLSTSAWIVAFVVACISATALLKTADRILFGRGAQPVTNMSGYNPQNPPAVLPSAASPGTPVKPPASSPRDQHREAMKLLAEGSIAQQDAIGQIERWKNEIEPLLQDPSGEIVAANETLVGKFAYVFGKKRMSEGEIQVLGEQIELLKKRLETVATQDDPEMLTAREMYDIRELHTKASTASLAWRRAVEQANAIVLKARMAANPVNQPSLEERIEEAKAEKTIGELGEEIAKGGPAEADIAPATEPTTSIDPDLRKKALSVEVKSVLAPFLEPRTSHPNVVRGKISTYETIFEEKPMSFGMLVRIGALEPSVSGLRMLNVVGGNRRLPEPRWPIAREPKDWKEDDQVFLKRAQDMLRDYGEILVSEGLLSP